MTRIYDGAPVPYPESVDDWLALTDTVQEWADNLKADLDHRVATKYEWEIWQMLVEAAARFRGCAAKQAAQNEVLDMLSGPPKGGRPK